MGRVLGILLVIVLSLMGAALGFTIVSGYYGVRGAFDGFGALCQVTKVAEAKQFLTKAQRAELAKAMFADGSKKKSMGMPDANDDQLIKYITGDCSKSLWQTIIDDASKGKS